MSEWITDRKPTKADFDAKNTYRVVYDSDGRVTDFDSVAVGEAWKPIPACEPYVKAKRFEVAEEYVSSYAVRDTELREFVAYDIPTREAAERIAAIYEEVTP